MWSTLPPPFTLTGDDLSGGSSGHRRGSNRGDSAAKSCAIMVIIAQRTDVRKRPFCRPHRGWLFGPGGGFPADSPPEEPSRARDPTSGRRNSMGIHSIGIHSIGIDSNGMGTIPMECIAMHSIPMDSNRLLSAEGNGLVKTTNESGGAFTTIPATPQITWR